MLGNEKILRLLMKLSVPAIIGMLVQASYNLVDTIFVGRGVGPLGIAGIAIAFPVQLMVLALGQTVGVGGASLISRSLGAGKLHLAERTMGNVFLISTLCGFGIAVLGMRFLVPLLHLFGATEAILPYSQDYLSTILFGTVFFTFSVSANNVVRSEGNAKVAMYTMIISGGLNILLDPIFIFVLGLGIRGAALATVLSQASMAVYLVYYFLSGKSTMRWKLPNMKPNFSILKEIFTVGASEFARLSAGSIMVVTLNNSLALYGGDMAIAVFGVLFRLLSFLFMPMFGIVQGLQPIVGFNFGAGKYQRVKEAVKLGVLVTTSIALLGFTILQVYPREIISVFTNDPTLIQSGILPLRWVVLAFPLVGFQIIAAGMFQALGKALPSFILSLMRQIIFLIPLVLILPLYLEVDGIWLAFPVADSLSAIVTGFVMVGGIRFLNNQIDFPEKGGTKVA